MGIDRHLPCDNVGDSIGRVKRALEKSPQPLLQGGSLDGWVTMFKKTNKTRLSDSIYANNADSLKLKQEQAIEEMARRGKYDSQKGIAAIKAVRSSS